MLTGLFLQQKKKPLLPHAMLSLLFSDPLPFSDHPQEVSLYTRLYIIAQTAEAETSEASYRNTIKISVVRCVDSTFNE